jgi:hypothetical protein
MNLRQRHEEASRIARELCRLDSVKHAMVPVVGAAVSIAFIWLAGGQTEAWGEFLAKAGATVGILLIFPAIYVWSFAVAGQMPLRRSALMLVAIGIVVILAGITIVGIGTVQFRSTASVSQSAQLNPTQVTEHSGPINWNQIFGTTRAIDRVFALLLDGKSVSS